MTIERYARRREVWIISRERQRKLNRLATIRAAIAIIGGDHNPPKMRENGSNHPNG